MTMTDQQQEARWHLEDYDGVELAVRGTSVLNAEFMGLRAAVNELNRQADVAEALRKDLQETGDNWVTQTAQLVGRIEALRTENARLREALAIANLQITLDAASEGKQE